jgi:hypothetical protein
VRLLLVGEIRALGAGCKDDARVLANPHTDAGVHDVKAHPFGDLDLGVARAIDLDARPQQGILDVL